ncbi:MAG: hypothetical protein IPL12_08165 [Bacteroidetes bacterium]|nr:hypothetical protein [Bacteroidota bacterium]
MDYYGNYGKVTDTITAIAASRQYGKYRTRMDAVSFLNEGTTIRWGLSSHKILMPLPFTEQQISTVV